MATDPSFSGVMTRVRAGDQDAATEVFRRFVNRLIALASHQFEGRFRSKTDPEDVVQSAYLSFFRRNSSSPFELSDWDSLWAVLVTITIRKCIDRRKFWRTQRRDYGRELGFDSGHDSFAWREVIDRGPTPLQALILSETLDECFRDQEPRPRAIIELILQGYSGVEIARHCGCSERTVSRVVQRLRDRLSRRGPAEGSA